MPRLAPLAPVAALALALLTASPARAAGWKPVAPAAAKAFIEKINAAVPEEKRDAAGLWPIIGPLVAADGLAHAVDVIGLDDDSTPHKVDRWLTAAQAAEAKGPLTLFFAIAEEVTCTPTDCVAEASHFATHVALRTDPAGMIRIVGVFDTNGMVDAARGATIAASRTAWLSAIDAKYGAQGGGQQGAAPTSAAPASAAPASAAPGGLPAITLVPPDDAAVRAGNAANVDGLAALKAGTPAKAILAFEAATRADPSNLLAFYNLACALNLAGRPGDARGVLAHLAKAPSCPGCQVRLVRARTDRDFASQHADPAFKAIVDPAKLPAVTAEAAAQAINQRFAGKATDLAPLVDSRGSVTIRVYGSLTDRTREQSVLGHALPAAIEALKGPADERVNLQPMEKMTCKGSCCRDLVDGLLHNTLFLDEVCVKTDKAGWTVIDRIEITDGE